jgi:hypothetical protein
MKNVLVESFLPELRGPNIYKNGRGSGSTAKVAIGRAFGDLLRQIKGKRVSVIKATVTIVEAQEDSQ